MKFLQQKSNLVKIGLSILLSLSFAYFFMEGPLEKLGKKLRFDHQLTKYAIPKLLSDQADKHTNGDLIGDVETKGFGHSLILNRKKQDHSFGLISSQHNVDIDPQLLGRLDKHAKKLFDNQHSFTVVKDPIAPYVLIQKEQQKWYYIESKEHIKDIRGYAGPINIGLIYTNEGKLAAVHHISSEETSSYLDKITKAGFYSHYHNLNLEDTQEIDGVSGATITTKAISETCSSLSDLVFPAPFGNLVDAPAPFNFAVKTIFSKIWIIHLIVIALLFAYGFQKTIVKKSKLMTTVVRILSIGYIGFYLNNSFTYTTIIHPFVGVNLSLLSGSYLYLVLIGAIWGKNIYCKYVCPFGNAQCLALQATKNKFTTKFFLKESWLRGGRAILSITLIVGIITGQDTWKNYELFPDLFSLDFLSHWFFLAAFFIVLSVKYPMIWCRSVCPTGWILDSVTELSELKVPTLGKVKWARPKLITTILLFLSIGGSAQVIHVFDENKSTFPFVQIGIRTDSSIIQIINHTGLDGVVDLRLKTSTRIHLSAMGYVKLDTLVSPGNEYKLYLEQDTESLDEVVITAQLSPSSTENAVQQVKVIDSRQIEAQGAITLNDVLSNETNIRLEQDNILGSSLSIQGLSGQNVKILIDGVPVIGRLDGNIDLSQINLSNIERIEIIEGPLSVEYGSNALAGTINLITKKDQAKNVSGTLETYYETVGKYTANATVGIKKKKSLWNMSLGTSIFTGWSDTTLERGHDWKPKSQYFGSTQYIHKGKNTTWRYTLEGFHEKISNLGAPLYIQSEVITLDDYYLTNRLNNALFISHYFKEKGKFEATTAYNYYNRKKNTYFKDLVSLNENLFNNPESHDTTSFDTFLARGAYSNFSKSPIQYQLGYDINYETGRGKRIKDGEQSIGDFALFTSLEWTVNKQLIIRPGVRYSYNTKYNAPLTPSLHIKYKYKSANFRLSYAQGFRAPSVKELYFDFVDSNHDVHGNEDLKAEWSHNIQASWNQAFKTKKKVRINSTIKVFYNRVNDQIKLVESSSTPNLYTNINIGLFESYGSSIQIKLLKGHFNSTLGATITGQRNYLDGVETVPDYYYSPELQGNLGYNLHKANASFNLFYKYNGEQLNLLYNDNEEEKIEQGRRDDYHIMDISFTKALLKKKQLKATLGFKNLFNVTSISSSNSGGSHNSGATSSPVSYGTTFFIKLNYSI